MEDEKKSKLYRFIEFSFIWIGFCFAIISISSFQWLITGPCCRSGLFSQCGDGSGGCVCSDHTGMSVRLTVLTSFRRNTMLEIIINNVLFMQRCRMILSQTISRVSRASSQVYTNLNCQRRSTTIEKTNVTLLSTGN